jgi:hypothetical protein
MIPLGQYQRNGKLCQQAISNCQELYFLEDTATPILQTDASNYSIGDYLYMVTNGKASGTVLHQGPRGRSIELIYFDV